MEVTPIGSNHSNSITVKRLLSRLLCLSGNVDVLPNHVPKRFDMIFGVVSHTENFIFLIGMSTLLISNFLILDTEPPG